ncbi:juvenile hormone epoxide hydrolase 1-like isoform X1 [Macrosteles quadrilineatus]|uniref:juvenile hormone epoxide hydrolase 1-like isoform X1 n=1 Tax=Macrosteles quadrilineatus TaxID=74068 RepID=UPI0023E2C148|nr:juvenile hormone epoxide hydrolase 1-like isoform X1 [Macrosteles quadrilineatus]
MVVRGLVLSVVIVLLAVGAGVYYDHLTAFSGAVPQLTEEWWGVGPSRADDTSIIPFKINYPKQVLDDLHIRLNNTRVFHPPLEGVGFEYGFNTKFLQKVLDFWKTKYSWEERQKYLNSFPQFTTEIQGLKIHFIHAKITQTKKPGLKVVPILLLHGWPGSVREFYELIPKLITQRPGPDFPFAFEVVAPSLPGYGFSEAAARPGLGAAQMAVVLHSLMERLGYDKYFVQGGDWGSIIGTNFAQMYPDNVIGLHLNMANVQPTIGIQLKLMAGSLYPRLICDEGEEKFTYPMLDKLSFLLEETGYLHIQATKPDTVGVALRDSPIGLAAYILEKFSTGTNPSWKSLSDGGLLKKYKLEDLLDNIMIYWLTGSATSSMRLYSESFNKKHMSMGFNKAPVTVVTGIARLPNEIANQPRSILGLKFKKIVHLTDFPTGGHFAAFEEPKLLADDIWKFASIANHTLTLEHPDVKWF